MSRILDPRAQRDSGRGFAAIEPVRDPGLSAAIDRVALTERAAPEGWSKPLVLPEGAVPIVLRSNGRGVLHRGWRNSAGSLGAHPRCHALPPRETLPLGAESWAENLRDHGRLCRYPWCFRAVVAELGIIPVVGHFSRKLRKRAVA